VFWEWHAGALRAAAAHGGEAPVGTLERGEGVAGAAAAGGQLASAPPVEPVVPEPAATALAVPLDAGGRLFGVLAVYAREGGGPFSDDEALTVHALAQRAEAAIVNTFLHEEANRLSITDGLTGLWNRRQFDLSCASEIERAARFGEPFAVAMVDLDRFKQVNDTHGHPAGDAMLVELARRLTESTREVDVVARYGGEEFILLLPRTDRSGAVRVAEKLAEAVRCEPFHFDDGSLDLTVSVGVAAYPRDGSTVRELVKSADDALYRAKDTGRDRVMAAVDEGAAELGKEANKEANKEADEE
jgi:diguanylate cyclase (GGDEF)-like protein